MRPPDDLKDWSKNDLVREVRRLRAITREHAESVGGDPREASTQDAVIGGSPYGHGDALIDARASVLLEGTEVVLVDPRSEGAAARLLLVLSGRINYADDRVEHAYQLNGDGAAAVVSQIIGLATRAGGGPVLPAQRFAAEFKVELERRMKELP